MRAQQHVGRLLYAYLFLYEEGVLHVACRVLRREVQHAVHVLVVLHLGPLRYREADTGEYLLYLFAHQRQRMTRAQRYRIRRTRQVQTLRLGLLRLKLLFQFVHPTLCLLTQLVQQLTQLTFLLRSYVAKLIEQRRYLTFLTQVFDAQRFQFLGTVGLQLLHLPKQRLYILSQSHNTTFYKIGCKGTTKNAYMQIFQAFFCKAEYTPQLSAV